MEVESIRGGGGARQGLVFKGVIDVGRVGGEGVGDIMKGASAVVIDEEMNGPLRGRGLCRGG
jgi:hypothetical protein